VKSLEDEVRSLRMMLGLMGMAMADLLEWARQVEHTGVVPAGTMDRAKKVVGLHSLQAELDHCNETLVKLNAHNAPTLQLELRKRVHVLRSDIMQLIKDIEDMEGKDGSAQEESAG